MDKSLYVAMTGATQITRAQIEVAHNLANANTTGFKAQMSAFRALPVEGPGLPTRVNAVEEGEGADLSAGAMIETGRPLDVAVQGDGWLSVQAADGSEAYTRAGNLRLTPDGLLTDARGNLVMGDGGAISVPPTSGHVQIGSDGTVSVVPSGQGAETLTVVGRLKLVHPDPQQIELGTDGLMRTRDGSTLATDPAVTVKSGVLESSNVNPSQMLVQMIELSRQYEMQIKTIKSSDENAQSASRLLQVG